MDGNDQMTGAESLVRTLVKGGVSVSFSNPGTSEMHYVAALDRVEGMRCVLGLFEGVCSGAADGYYRMTDKPAATLLHLGPGLANAAANLHNAKKARSGIVNVVGDHAVEHLALDAPLTSDIHTLAQPMSHWVRSSPTAAQVAADGAEAIRQARARPGQIATLILPANTAWTELAAGQGPCAVPAPQPLAASAYSMTWPQRGRRPHSPNTAISAPIAPPATASGCRLMSSTGPNSGNFGWRLASNMPQ